MKSNNSFPAGLLDILNMYRAMNFSHKRMKDKDIEFDEEVERELEFLGFDGNNETSRMGYVRYYIKELGRFSELVGERRYVDFNSHGAMTLEIIKGCWLFGADKEIVKI